MTASQCPDENLSSTQFISLLSLKAVHKMFAPALKSPTASGGVEGASSLHTALQRALYLITHLSDLSSNNHDLSANWQVNSSKARVSILRCLSRIVLCSFITFPQTLKCPWNSTLLLAVTSTATCLSQRPELWDTVDHSNYLQMVFFTEKRLWSVSPNFPQSTTIK